MGGTEKRPTSTGPSSQGVFSPTGRRLRELRWVMGLFAHGGERACYRGKVMRHHSARALIRDGPVVSTTL